MKVSTEPFPVHIDMDSEEASYLAWLLIHGLPANAFNRIEVIRRQLLQGLMDIGVKEVE